MTQSSDHSAPGQVDVSLLADRDFRIADAFKGKDGAS